MKKRIITAAVGLAALAVVLFFRNTYLMDVCVTLLNLVAVWEVLRATRYVTRWPLLALCTAYTVAAPFVYQSGLHIKMTALTVLFGMLLFCLALLKHKEVRPSQVALAFTFTALLAYAFNTMTVLLHMNNGLFYFILACNCAWLTDAGAYFIGVFFGKHKLAPEISPKKTVEGAVGGLVASFIASILICLAYQFFFLKDAGTISYLPVLILTPLLSLAGMLGDLSFSYIKRDCKLKDFGNLMPGHGGVMDRFDSFVVTAPLLLVALGRFTLIVLP